MGITIGATGSSSPSAVLRPWSNDLKLCAQGECNSRFLALPKAKMEMYMQNSRERNQTLAAIQKAKDRIRSKEAAIRDVQHTLDQIGNGEIKGHGTEGKLSDKIADLRLQEETLAQVVEFSMSTEHKMDLLDR